MRLFELNAGERGVTVRVNGPENSGYMARTAFITFRIASLIF